MTNEAMRIAIALLMGYEGCKDAKCQYRACQHLHFLELPYFPESYSVPMYPNYPADLNSCAEFENTLDVEDGSEYRELLMDFCGTDLISGIDAAIMATAEQRCIAFLKVKGKWVE